MAVSNTQLQTLRFAAQVRLLRDKEGVLHRVDDGAQIDERTARRLWVLLRLGYLELGLGGFIRLTYRGQRAEHEMLYQRYVFVRDRYQKRASARHPGPATKRFRQQCEDAKAALLAYEAKHPEFQAKTL
jgi:hypothetical protein